MRKQEVFFIQHCDNVDCALGSVQFKCPRCNHNQTQFDLWYKQDEIWQGETEWTKCNNCLVNLSVHWDKQNFEYYVQFNLK